MTYIPQPMKEEGGKQEVAVADEGSQQMLGYILKELKKMNMHLEILSDNTITDQELE